jgi:hypothetical protein
LFTFIETNIQPMKNIYFLFAAVVLMAQSCTIQKRQHLPGYHIEWNSNEAHSEVQKTSKEKREEKGALPMQTECADANDSVQEANLNVGASINESSPQVQTQVKQVVVSQDKHERHHKVARLTFPTILHSPTKLLFGGINPDEKPRTDGMSIAAMVCGIVGVLIPGSGIILSILAIIFGGIGMGRTSRNTELKGKGMAITGLVLGIVGVLLTVLVLVVLSLSFGFAI